MSTPTIAGAQQHASHTHFVPAQRVSRSLTAAWERRALLWMASRTPAWLSSDLLTGIGLGAQLAAGAFYAIARYHHGALILVIGCIVLNWCGDSMDGTVARVRGKQRPRYGFYVDHMVDVFGAVALMAGLGCSGFLHAKVAIAMLVGFLVLSAESYLATYSLSRFELSHSLFGPTEIRLLLIAGTLALLRSPYSTLFGRKLLLFDVGGTIAACGMFATAIVVTVRHTAELFREEPLP